MTLCYACYEKSLMDEKGTFIKLHVSYVVVAIDMINMHLLHGMD